MNFTMKRRFTTRCANGNRVFGRFFYSPRLDALSFVSGSQVNVFAL